MLNKLHKSNFIDKITEKQHFNRLYCSFLDYLVSITADAPMAHNQVLEKEEEGQGHPRDTQVAPEQETRTTTTARPTEEQNTEDILGYFRG